MSTNLTRVLFTIKAGRTHHGIGILGIKHSPAELFYHSAWPKHIKRKLLNTTTKQETKRPDHFSCHADGKCHIKAGNTILGEPRQFPDNSFLPKDASSISPLLIHSIKATQDLYTLPLINEIDPDAYQLVQEVANIAKPQNFSISLFLVPSTLSTNDALSSMYIDFKHSHQAHQRLDLRNLCTDSFLPGRLKIDAWKDWDIILVLSDLTMLTPPEIEPRDHFKLMSLPYNPDCFTIILGQRIGSIEFFNSKSTTGPC